MVGEIAARRVLRLTLLAPEIAALLPQLLYSMLLIIDDRRRKGHGAGHPHMSDRDEECFLFVQRDDVAHYSTFIAGIGQVRDYTVCLIGMG
jgi:hypothetical protein